MKKFLYLILFCFACISCKMNYDQVTRNRDIESISVDTSGAITNYCLDDEFSARGIIVTAHYTDGTKETVSTDSCIFTHNEWNSSGSYSVKVEYAGCMTSFNVDVGDGEIVGISVYSKPEKLYYTNINDPFEPRGLIINAIYKTGKITELDENKYDIILAAKPIYNKKRVTIVLKKDSTITSDFDLFYETSIPDFRSLTPPKKITYLQGVEELDFNGFAVNLNGNVYNNIEALERVYISPMNIKNLSSGRNQKISVYINEQKKEFSINVLSNKVTGLDIAGKNEVYCHAGESVSLIDLFDFYIISKTSDKQEKEKIEDDVLRSSSELIKYTYNENSKKDINEKIIFNETGKQFITFYYEIDNGGEKETWLDEVEIFVYEPRLKSITAKYTGPGLTFKEFPDSTDWTITGTLANGTSSASISPASCNYIITNYNDLIAQFKSNGTLGTANVKVDYYSHNAVTKPVTFTLENVKIKQPTQTGILIKPINGSINIPNTETNYSSFFGVYKTYDCGIDCTDSSVHIVSAFDVTKFIPDFGGKTSVQGVIKVTTKDELFTVFHEATFTKTDGAQ